jgi:hypothetical protein
MALRDFYDAFAPDDDEREPGRDMDFHEARRTRPEGWRVAAWLNEAAEEPEHIKRLIADSC